MSTPKIIIPARAGSKGWPGKNIALFEHTAEIIPQSYKKFVTVTTDSETISDMAKSAGFKKYSRSSENASDNADIKAALQEVITPEFCEPKDVIIVLYLTYPGRTWDEISKMYNKFVSLQAKSMLCRQPVKSHPCLVMLDNKDGTGTQVIKHKHYQRQQYPECFEISHYISMFRASTLTKLNKNLYNKDTIYHNIERVVDVDSEIDYKLYMNNTNLTK